MSQENPIEQKMGQVLSEINKDEASSLWAEAEAYHEIMEKKLAELLIVVAQKSPEKLGEVFHDCLTLDRIFIKIGMEGLNEFYFEEYEEEDEDGEDDIPGYEKVVNKIVNKYGLDHDSFSVNKFNELRVKAAAEDVSPKVGTQEALKEMHEVIGEEFNTSLNHPDGGSSDNLS